MIPLDAALRRLTVCQLAARAHAHRTATAELEHHQDRRCDVNVRWTLEDSLIHLVRLIRAAPNSSEWVVNPDFIGMSEIFVDHLQIASIERAVELANAC
jgi:hypothetical protein